MNTIRLTLVFIFIFFLTGCQHSSQITQKPVNDDTFSVSSGPNAQQTTQKSKTSLSPAADIATTSKPTANSERQTSDANFNIKAEACAVPKSPDQKKIDQALEFCSLAQGMWEEGNLEDAIANLDSAYYLILEIENNASEELSQQKEDIRYLISKRILEIYASRQIVVTGNHDAIPITMNTHVKREIKRLTGPERNFFIRAMERSSMYRPFIVQELKKAGLPEDLSWLPLIESGFKLKALSPARALGLWQFIPSTGHKFGLNRNYYIDERMDPEKSTRAAIAYLKELHNLFGDWATVLAAYNCGEFRVLRTIRRQKINYLDNFWDLYQNLPRETARYVPRFLATVHIVNNLEKYNITLKSPKSPIAYKTFNVKKQIRLSDIAREINVKTSLLSTLNPELRHLILPSDTYELKIPLEKADTFLARLDKIKPTSTSRTTYVYHRVRKGDTLSGIARKYKTSVKRITSCNRISKNYRIIAGKVLKIPARNYSGNYASATTPKKAASRTKSLKYKVRRGDNLWLIAKKFSVTTKQIMAQNGLSNTMLHIGQVLTISSGKSSKTTTKSSYQVKSGDSPFLIAQKHNMSLNRLLALNRLSKRSKIYPGQKLIVE